ncbi:alpha/beta hydrolase [Rhodopseudomonas boonkerdii]|uniref:alpha/beta fold hydrolase n=1 Tax=Rhodopseudomonas boonkerdii TaxID=475937 RepID=UPI001E361472|nr:alpha/beta hydrolase [Rhodopseudomonas boonkerdii]UGV24374.1 alpha/beta hydrolase [Rhodopseudomonas boonkerdii]
MAELARIRTPLLDLAYEQSGPSDGLPAILLHGFPYDIRSYDDAAALINDAGFRTIVPYLRGYGPTRFLSKETIRSGQQAALGQDLLDFMDALRIEKAVVAGYDWGGRAACIVSALWPERVHGLVSCTGYNIQDLTNATRPYEPEQEVRQWYQYYFHTERGRNGLTQNHAGISKLLWKMWSPSWDFDDATFARSASSFDNEDFVDVVVQSYMHRTASVAGDPAYDFVEDRLAAQPRIDVPTIVLHGEDDGVGPVKASENHGRHFTGHYERRVIAGAGHNVPQEKPQEFAEAVIELCRR